MLRKRATRYLSNRPSRFQRLASLVQFEMLESRVLLSVTPALQNGPVAPPPLPSQPTPLQGVVGTPLSLDPQLINGAYGFNDISFNVSGSLHAANGTGQTIAIVDAYGSPTIIQDLQAFDAHWGISNADAEGNFALTVQSLAPTINTVIGSVVDRQGWTKEISLDVEWAHAVAPGAHILLVNAASDTTLDLFDAVAFAAAQANVDIVSMSWGNNVSTYVQPTDYDGFMVTPTGHNNVLFVAASGDNHTLDYPAASQEVLSVGGETTDIGLNGAIQVTGAWSGSGGGSDTLYAKPYPTPFVSLNADPLTGVWVFDSSPDPGDGPVIDGGWSVVGGTSFACPAWAALMSIIDQGLSYRGIQPLNTSQALGLQTYDERGITTIGTPAALVETPPFGIFGLMEAGIPAMNGGMASPFFEPDGHASSSDLDTLFSTFTATSYPLWNTTMGPVPDLTKNPDNGNTGWGAPNGGSFNFVEDMVGGETSANDALNVVVPDVPVPQLNFTVQPASELAGQLIPVTVTVFVPGNASPDSAYSGSITLSILGGTPGAVLNGTTTVNVVNGSATFSNLTINTDGTYQLIASSASANSNDSNAFTISSLSVVSELSFVAQPSALFQFGSFTSPVIVGIADQFGNVVTSASSAVTVSIFSGPAGGILEGNTTVTATNGRATFTGLKLNVPGTYKLIATDGALSVTSSVFQVVPIPVALHYTFNGAALSAPALLFEQERNAPLFTSKSAPSAAEIAVVAAADNNLQMLQSLTATAFVPAQAVRVSPSTFAAVGSPISGASDNVTAQLLDSGKSGVNPLLDN
jgi:subtilase family serine protease